MLHKERKQEMRMKINCCLPFFFYIYLQYIAQILFTLIGSGIRLDLQGAEQ